MRKQGGFFLARWGVRMACRLSWGHEYVTPATIEARRMIIFLDDDRAYRSWVTHHRRGFVLDGRRRPKARKLDGQSGTPHPTSPASAASRGSVRATSDPPVSPLRKGGRKRTHFTSGGRVRRCAATLGYAV